MAKKEIKLGLFGLGVVGSGVVDILTENSALLEQRLGVPLCLKSVVCANPKKKRSVSLGDIAISDNPSNILADPEIDIVIEVMGGISPAREIIIDAMERKKAVVTANKALLAECASDIFQKAQQNNVALGMEATVASGIPILRTIRDGMVANHIKNIFGIINGTCNYILSNMSQSPYPDFKTVLSQAQKLGYAEADPTLDIEGSDSAHKLTLLTNLAFGTIAKYSDIYQEGITKITPLDIQYTERMGCLIKLLAIVSPQDSPTTTVQARVHPTLIPFRHPMALVDDAFNAIFVVGDKSGPILCYGRGAGASSTASAIIGDVVEISRALLQQIPKFAPPLGVAVSDLKQISIQPMGKTRASYYLRFQVSEQVGTIDKIVNIMGLNNISIKSFLQPSLVNESQAPVQLVLTTGQALEDDMQTSLKQIKLLPFIRGETQMIRFLETTGRG